MIIDVLDNETLKVTFPYDPKPLEALRSLPNRTFDKKNRYWKFPAMDLFILKKILKEHNISASITQPAQELFTGIANQLKKIKEISEAKTSDFIVRGLKSDVELYPFQKVGVDFLASVGSGLMGMDMGLGKTLMGTANASNGLIDKKIERVLVLCPASVKNEWAIQLAKFTDYSYTVVSGKNREELYNRKTDFIIMNYDLLWRDIDIVKKIKWDMVIGDEIQRARNYKTDTVKCLKKIDCDIRIGLTGTPIENDLMDLFTIMKFINPKIFGTNATSFKNRYCTVDYFGRIDPTKYKNLDEINKKLSFIMIRRRKREVLDDLPEKIVNHFYVNLNPEETKKYREIKSGLLEDIEGGKLKSVNALTQVGYLRQLCDCLNLVITKDKMVSSKFAELKQIVDDLPKESKIVLFTQYERMAKLIEDNIGYRSVHLHGGVKNDCKWENELDREVRKTNKDLPERDLDLACHKAKQKAICGDCAYYEDKKKCHTRKKIQYRFNNDPGVKLFISTDAGKAGLNLQIANVVINYDLSFNPAVNEQRIARIDRIGQKSEKVLVINLICVDTIEEKVLKILGQKQKLFDKVIDNIDDDAEFQRIILNNKNIKDLI